MLVPIYQTTRHHTPRVTVVRPYLTLHLSQKTTWILIAFHSENHTMREINSVGNKTVTLVLYQMYIW
jgi:hypothetical protein